jgi:DNA-binding response OmpR family regulator
MDISGPILLVLTDASEILRLKQELVAGGVMNRLFVMSSTVEADLYLNGVPPYDDRISYPLPVVVILSLSFPGEAAFKWTRKLRDDARFAALYIICVADVNRLGDVPNSYAAGASACFIGGIDSEALSNRVKAFFSASAHVPNDPPPDIPSEDWLTSVVRQTRMEISPLVRAPDPLPTFLMVAANPVQVRLLKQSLAQIRIRNPVEHVFSAQVAMRFLSGKSRSGTGGRPPFPLVIFVDLNLSDTYAMLGWLEGHPEFKRRGIIVLTNTHDMRRVIQAYHLGANSFVVQPPKPEDLRNALLGIPEVRIYSDEAGSWLDTDGEARG